MFEIVYSEFNKLSNEKVNDSSIDLKEHPIILKHENYKREILKDAKNQLLLNTWKENDIGSGRILRNIINAIYIKSNNLINWRKQDDFKKLKANKENEQFLFDFFKSKITDEIAFNDFIEIGFSYQLIAYLFFIKNHQKYMPISQENFDKIFSSINIDFKTSHNCSWENYLEYNDIIKQFRKLLSYKYKTVSLLDAHSFLWTYSSRLEKPKKKSEPKEETQKTENKTTEKPKEKTKLELETYKPKKVVDLESLSETSIEIDYIENHRNMMEIGALAEKFVLKNEKDFLNIDFPELAEKVKLVSNNPKLGFDVLSYETDGKQKQIEVKAISINNNSKSFIITRNEFSKSKTYPNYYIYCVTEINSEKPKILRIKNPDLENNDDFLKEPLTYKITFE